MKETQDYEEQVLDLDEIKGSDIKINPDFYIHTALLKAQQCLTDNNTKEGFLKYYIFIEHIEVLCRAAKMVPDDFDENVQKEEKKYSRDGDSMVAKAKIANFKLHLLMDAVFSKKTITGPVRI